MEQNTKGIGKIIKQMEKENFFIQMETLQKANGNKIN